MTFIMATLSTYEVENQIRNKKKVSSKLLWRWFGILWGGFMSLLLYQLVAQIGSLDWDDKPSVFSNNFEGSMFPKYDF